MNKLIRRSTVLLLIIPLVIVPFGASAFAQQDYKVEGENSGSKMAADLVIARPLGIVATVFGCAVFIVSLPFSALGGNTKQAAEKLVKEPAVFTFKRPLGEF